MSLTKVNTRTVPPSHTLRSLISDHPSIAARALGRTAGCARANCHFVPQGMVIALRASLLCLLPCAGRRPLEAPEGVDRKEGRPDPELCRGGGERPILIPVFTDFLIVPLSYPSP